MTLQVLPDRQRSGLDGPAGSVIHGGGSEADTRQRRAGEDGDTSGYRLV
jgi:hypothetical protein